MDWSNEDVKTLNLYKKIYVYWAAPCDFWDGMIKANNLEESVILKLMPEFPRDRIVYKAFLPGNGCGLEAFYFCKADNNGTTYIFSNCKISVKEDIDWTLEKVIKNIEFKEEKEDESI